MGSVEEVERVNSQESPSGSNHHKFSELTNNTNNTSNEDDGRRHSVGTSSGGDQSVATPKQSILLARSTHKSVMIIDGGGGQPKEKPKTDGDGLYEEEVVYEARKTQTDMAREAVSKQLISLLEEDSKEFTELDIKEMMPATPFSDVSFLKLRHFFDTVIQDLNTANKVGVPLDEVKEEFYFIWDGILKAHTNMKDLLQKDVTLSVEVADTMAKTRNLIKIAEDHPEITARLGSRLETAWNLVDVSEEEEKKNAARIEELKTDIMILNRNIQAAANMEGQNELTELMKIRRKLQDERDVLLKDMGRMRTSLSLLQERKSRLGEKRVEYLEAIKYADEEAAAQTEALQRETARKHSMEKEIERLIHSIEKKTKELNDIEKYYSSAKIKLLDLERGVSTQKVINEGALKDAETAFAKLDKLKHDFEAQVELVERLAVETFKKQSDLKDKEDEIIKIKAEGMQAVRQRNTNMKRCAVLQERLDALEADREALKAKIIELEKELEAAQKKLEENRRKVEELDKKRTIVNRNLTRATALASEHDHQLKVHLVASNNLEREMESYKGEITAQSATIRRLERERDYYSHEATKLAHEFASRLDEIKKMDTIVFEFQKKISELEGTVKTKCQEYEQSLVEKRFFEKLLRDTGTALLEAQTEVRNKTFELNMAVYSYYDEQNKYAKQKSYLEGLLREGTFFKAEADRIRKMAIDMSREVEALESERSLLGCGVAEAENELSKQRYYALQAESRRKNYNRRLQQREAELQEIWSKWRTLHSMVRIGAYHFRRLIAEIREVRQSIVNLRRLQHKFKGNVSHIVTLQQEISVLENCIAKETCMVNALEDELARPINVHRWRALEAIDPDAYDVIKKINIVTKRLVDQNESIRAQSIRVADKERIYVDLRHVLRRLPSIETPELRRHYDVLLAAKKDQLKRIKLDLYAMESQTKYFRTEVSKINERMKELKKAYFDKMKKSGTPGTVKTAKSLVLPPLRASRRLTDLNNQHPFEEFQQDVENGSMDVDIADLDIGRLSQTMDISTIQELYRRFSDEQQTIEERINARKSVIEELHEMEIKEAAQSRRDSKRSSTHSMHSFHTMHSLHNKYAVDEVQEEL